VQKKQQHSKAVLYFVNNQSISLLAHKNSTDESEIQGLRARGTTLERSTYGRLRNKEKMFNYAVILGIVRLQLYGVFILP